MSTSDWQMAKVSDPDIINLAVGEPHFLQNELRRSAIPAACTATLSGLEYPPFGGNPALIAAIKRLPLCGGYDHVVITNGAKQAISAALYAASEVRRAKRLVHAAPHWPSYPTLAFQSGMQFSAIGSGADTVVAITSPNNPDGHQVGRESCYLWDAAYASALYGYNGELLNADVMVISLAKMLGVSGLRVGAALTNDADLARSMAYFVEISTSGVATTAQEQCTAFLQYLETPHGGMEFSEVTDRARKTLEKNRCFFEEYVRPYCEFAAYQHGMFAWFRPTSDLDFNSVLREAKVRLVDGDACGMPGWYRMSLGIDTENFATAVRAISNAIIHK